VRVFVGACVHACVCSWLVSCAWMARVGLGGLWREVMEPMTSGRGEHRESGLQQTCQYGDEARHAGVMFPCECRVAWQTKGATPLYIANKNGHVECVRALLDGGAAINQATVGRTSSMARHRGGCVCGASWEPACVHAFLLQLVGCAGMARVGGSGREVMEPMPYFRSWGTSREWAAADIFYAVVRSGMA
jgi:hypothetical protein